MTGELVFISSVGYLNKDGNQRFKINLLNQDSNDVESYFTSFNYSGETGDLVVCDFSVRRYGQNTQIQLNHIQGIK